MTTVNNKPDTPLFDVQGVVFGDLIHPALYEEYFGYCMLLEVSTFIVFLLSFLPFWHVLSLKKVRGLKITLVGVAMNVPFAIAIERFVATKNLNYYEEQHMNAKLAWRTIIALSIIFLGAMLFLYRNIVPPVVVYVNSYCFQFMAIWIAGQIWLIILLEADMRSAFKALFNAKVQVSNNLRDAVGNKMQFESLEETNIYFAQLRSMWN
ncbi:unnamed protein product, partial [Mesorhabditis spiculigera]